MSKKRLLIRTILFFIVFSIIFLILEKQFFSYSNVHGTWKDIQNEDLGAPDVLFIGNSHIYRSINPNIIEETLSIKAEILGSASQTAPITLQNLDIVLDYKIPKCIIIECYIFCLDNNSMKDILENKRGFIFDNFDGVENYGKKSVAISKILPFDNYLEGMFQLFRPTNIWSRWDNLRAPATYRTKNGYEELSRVSDVGYTSERAIIQSELYNNIQSGILSSENQEALYELLNLAKSKDIPVYLYMNPVCEKDMELITKNCIKIQEMIKEYDDVHWLGDWNLNLNDIGFDSADFYDKGHLNRRGTVKNTLYMIEKLEKIFDTKADFSSLFTYKSEHIIQLDNGSYRITVENFSSDTKYSFRLLDESRQLIYETEYSLQNYIDLNTLPQKKQSIVVYMLPKDCDLQNETEILENRVSIEFMRDLDTNEMCLIQ